MTFHAVLDKLTQSIARCDIQSNEELDVLVLLCAVTIGQIEDVAALRDRYEKAQASYDRLQAMYVRARTSLEDAEKRESTRSGSTVIPTTSTNPRVRALREKLAEQRKQRDKMNQAFRRKYSVLLRQLEASLRRLKQTVDSLKWQYQRAVGRASEHWA